MADNFYRILNCPREATQGQVLQAYRAAVRRCHPDLHPGDPYALSKFLQVQAAFEVLGNAQRREAYDPDKVRETRKPRRQSRRYRPRAYGQGPNINVIVFSRTVCCRRVRRPVAPSMDESESLRNVQIGTYASLIAAYVAVTAVFVSGVLGL